MDHYPKVNVSERECASRQPSNASSLNKEAISIQHKSSSQETHLAPPQYTSFPSPSNATEQGRIRNDSVHGNDTKHIEAAYSQYTDAPPPYSAKQYEGKTEEQQNKMRMADYAKELKRMMGRQLVRGIKSGETKVEQ
jgi:hypothetical protein